MKTGLPNDAAFMERAFVNLVRWLRPAQRMPAWAQYAITILLVLAALALRLALEDIYRYPFLTFYCAILLAALLFGWGLALSPRCSAAFAHSGSLSSRAVVACSCWPMGWWPSPPSSSSAWWPPSQWRSPAPR
ncbi:hypothetical protein ACFQU2_00695 [Siccirubricoccus deserti]